ncbi:hypothetical protein V5O48_018110 [Marasmius crinis-equi]|uniref:Gustatory receptor n=1 Tax=Marasmius crinis-equi TaxID=585013 RepID=A0ABR3EM66_9AGAR
MTKDLPVDVVEIAAFWTEAVLYGLYTCLFFICLYVLLYVYPKRNSTSKVNIPLLFSAIAMYLLCTTHMAVDFHRAIMAFTGSGNAEAYYARFWDRKNIIRLAIYVSNKFKLQLLTKAHRQLDSGLSRSKAAEQHLRVYRLYVVWNYQWKVAFIPVVMLIATSLCGYIGVWQYSHIQPGSDAFVEKIVVWGQVLFGLSLATNIMGTALPHNRYAATAGRIWWVGRRIESHASEGWGLVKRHRRAAAMMIESGALYSLSFLIFIILYATSMQAMNIAFDALVQITGIAPTLIIVRVALVSAAGENTSPTPSVRSGRSHLHHSPDPDPNLSSGDPHQGNPRVDSA